LGDTENGGEILGIEAFLSRPENYGFGEELFNDIEKYVYHAVDYGASIVDRDKYELGRYCGKAQILFEFGKYILKKSNDEKVSEKVAKAMFTVIDNASEIYVLLVKNVEMSKFGDVLKIYKESVDKLNEIVSRYSDIWFFIFFLFYFYEVKINVG